MSGPLGSHVLIETTLPAILIPWKLSRLPKVCAHVYLGTYGTASRGT